MSNQEQKTRSNPIGMLGVGVLLAFFGVGIFRMYESGPGLLVGVALLIIGAAMAIAAIVRGAQNGWTPDHR